METTLNEKVCRICLSLKKPMLLLFKYNGGGGNYAEMLTAVADVKVSNNDGLPERICSRCANALEKAFFLKTVAERNDRKLRKCLIKSVAPPPTKKLVFDSIKDIKSEINILSVKSEPKWELDVDLTKPVEVVDGQDVVIANTVIKKCDPNERDKKPADAIAPEVTWNMIKNDKDVQEVEYLDDDVFQGDDDDVDYEPPKAKFKKPKPLSIPVKMGNKKQTDRFRKPMQKSVKSNPGQRAKATTMITCYPIMKNGQRGKPITLKRPKDSTTYKSFTSHNSSLNESCIYSNDGVSKEGKPVRKVKPANPPVSKAREKLVCPVCGILTFTLGNHMATHNEKKKFTCPTCPKTFTQKGNLEAHVKYHSGIKDHICEICGAGFYNQKSLQRHNLIHKGERPFACHLCSKTFIARCDLNRHLRIHSGYKPYKCETCSMSFNAKHQLQNHERMHTGERPYTCQVCNVAFSYKVNLNNHVFKVHGINLKFKSIHTVTSEVLQKEIKEINIENEARAAIASIIPVPPAAAHETVAMSETITFD